MKLYKNFRVRRGDIPSPLYFLIALILRRAPTAYDLVLEARSGEVAKLWKLRLLVGLCRAFHLTRTLLGSPGSYGLDVARNYEASDFAASELLLIRGQQRYQLEDERDNEGRLLLKREFARELRLGSVWNWTVVSEEVRQILEAAGLRGLQFREAVPRDFAAKRGRFWELESSIVLPKMANTDRLWYSSWRKTPPQPFTGDYSRMVFINDPPYRSGEVYYRRSDLLPLGTVDIAKTFEFYRQPHRVLIISQRFYQTCLRNGMPLILEPVRIDDRR